MGRLGALRQLLGGHETDASYECLTCNTRFDRQYQVCPECDGYDIRHIEWIDGRSSEGQT